MMRSDAASDDKSERVLVFVGNARDGELTNALLVRAGLQACICSSVVQLVERIEEGAAAALVAEELLGRESVEPLVSLLARQPPWSDFPLIVFSSGGVTARVIDELAPVLGNVTILDRPVRTHSMLAAVRAAIRARRRQYEGRRAIESRDTFLATLGHELRNPLGAIRLAVAALQAKSVNERQPREYEVIDRQSTHLTRLIDDLLDVARITHGKVVLQRGPLNLVDLVRNTYEAVELRARERQLTCEFECSQPDIWIDGDRARLEQIFANLLTNAIKYTPRGCAIRVGVSMTNGEAIASISDTGVGLAKDMLEKIFDAFTQVDRSLDRRDGGIGLGLAVVRNLVQLHGGRVEAASEGLGLGSSFTVFLPALDGAPSHLVPISQAPDQHAPAKRVVVVEDSRDIRELMTELLEHEGHQVNSAGDGPEGLETILKTVPDVAFIDLGLPGFDGLELARRARRAGSTSRLIAVTGYGQPDDRKRAADAGFDDHLTKPIVPNALNQAILRTTGLEAR